MLKRSGTEVTVQREFLKAKIHRATLTGSNLEYEGSFTIDEDIMDAAGILEYEKIHIYNVNNGARLETYAIKGRRGGRQMELNGAAARLGMPGDRVIIVSYCTLDESEVAIHKPVLLLMTAENEIAEAR
jgi:aspartate 1-decarboxylase